MRIATAAAGPGLLVAACVVCCAPLIAPSIFTGTAGLAISGPVALGLVAAALGAGVLYRRRLKARLTAAPQGRAGCECAPDAGCNTGDACAVPVRRRRTALARLRSMC